MGLTLLATGGYFDDSGECVLLAVDLGEGRVRDWARWTPPRHLRVPTKGFTGSDRLAGAVYVCGHACVTRWDLDGATLDGVLHQPDFNDLHDVAVVDGALYVVVTGSDAVDRFNLDGDFEGRISFLPGWALVAQHGGNDLAALSEAARTGWAGAPPAATSRRLVDAYYSSRTGPEARPFWQQKVPDHLHLNHIVGTAEGPVVTCLRDGTLRSLRSFAAVAELPGNPHDGQNDGDHLWCTTVDGGIWRVCLRGEAPPERFFEAFSAGICGWCRGLLVTPEVVVVGLTAVQDGRAPPGMWPDEYAATSKTGVVVLDRRTGAVVQWVDLTDCARGFKLFSFQVVP